MLLLFCSGFGGINDGWWAREAGLLDVTAVDIDEGSMRRMEAEYPDEWQFRCADAFVFAKDAARLGARWDVVSADLPSNLPVEMVSALPLWYAIARKYVVSTLVRHNFPGEPDFDELPPPAQGWQYEHLIQRSDYRGGVWWLVSGRA
jgi:hypothetical protein